MEEIKISGKISHVLEMKAGVGASSGKEWKKQTFVLEKQRGEYVDRIAFDVWGDKIDEWGLKVGDEVTLSLDINAREYQGRWYNDVRAYKCERGEASGLGQESRVESQEPQPQAQQPAQPKPQPQPQARPVMPTNGTLFDNPQPQSDNTNDLPF